MPRAPSATDLSDHDLLCELEVLDRVDTAAG